MDSCNVRGTQSVSKKSCLGSGCQTTSEEHYWNRMVFRTKPNELGEVVRNIARLVTQGYNQQYGIDYTETFDLVARLEAISRRDSTCMWY